MTSVPSRPITIRHPTAEDAALLAALGASTFRETFGADNDPADMAAYLAGAFGEPLQRADVGMQHFRLASDLQADRVMARAVAGAG